MVCIILKYQRISVYIYYGLHLLRRMENAEIFSDQFIWGIPVHACKGRNRLKST